MDSGKLRQAAAPGHLAAAVGGADQAAAAEGGQVGVVGRGAVADRAAGGHGGGGDTSDLRGWGAEEGVGGVCGGH